MSRGFELPYLEINGHADANGTLAGRKVLEEEKMKQNLLKFYRGPDEEDYNDEDFEDDYQLYCKMASFFDIYYYPEIKEVIP